MAQVGMFVTVTGNVGIGTSLPQQNLDVVGTVQTSNLKVSGTVEYTSPQNANLQVPPIRKVFYVDTGTQSIFDVTTPGVYGGHASNAQVFVGQNLLKFYSDTVKDYSLNVTYETSNTIYTITLQDAVDYGSLVDVTIWPTILPTSVKPGALYQSVNVTSQWQSGANSDIYFYTSGNVGIGTTLPTAALHVRPSSTTTGVIIDQVGTGSILDIKDGGVSKVIVDGQGNVGIGTTSPQASLHINGSLYSSGSVVQIQTTVYTGADSYSGTTFADINASFGVTITPKFANSKILVQGMLHIGGQQSTDARFTFIRLVRIVNAVATEIGNGTNSTTSSVGTPCIAAHNWGSLSATAADADYNIQVANISVIYVDTPSTINAVTYRFRWNPNPGAAGGGRVCYLNRTHSHVDGYRPNTVSTITVTEIAQ